MLLKLLFIDTYLSNRVNDEIKNIYYSNDDESTEENRFTSLLELNPDIYGWISISGTKIDYPVLMANAEEPEFYLKHNYKRENSKYGSIFIDSRCRNVLNPKNTIIYGHHMADGQMFADLMKYSELNFYKEHPIIKFDTIKENSDWKIISIFKTNTLPEHGKIFNYIITDFDSNSEFLKYVGEVRKRSLLNIPVDVNQNDRLITLSTCSSEFKNFRTVVVARKVRNGEDSQVNVNLASKSDNPLMPDCWYERYGGSAPN